jgi:nucleoside-diphosphate-sugar epimerase
MSLSPRKVLVTGATGYIGSHLIPRLLRNGYDVSVLTRKTSSRPPSWGDAVKIYPVDCSYAEIDEALRRSDPGIVVHLASQFLVSHAPEDVESIVTSNILFGALLVEAMARRGRDRLIHASTYWTHYEGAAYNPVNLYAASKKAFLDLLEFYCEADRLTVLNLELYDTYGPGDKRRKIVNILLDQLGAPSPLLLSPGDQQLDLVHINDVVSALCEGLKRVFMEPAGRVRTYQVRTGTSHTLKSLVGLIEKASGEKLDVVFGGRPYRSREVMRPYAGGELLPGWQAETPLAEGIKEAVEARSLRKTGNSGAG